MAAQGLAKWITPNQEKVLARTQEIKRQHIVALMRRVEGVVLAVVVVEAAHDKQKKAPR